MEHTLIGEKSCTDWEWAMKPFIRVIIWRLGSRVTLLLLIVVLISATVEPVSACLTSTPPFGGWLVLDGDDDYAETGDHPELEVGDEAGESLTLEAWAYIRQSGFTPQWYYIFNKPKSYLLYVSAYSHHDPWPVRDWLCAGLILTRPSGELWWGGESCDTTGDARGWHHVALVFYGETGEARIYMDGEAKTGLKYFGPVINNSAEAVRVGKDLPGGLDEVRISDVARYTGSTYTLPTCPFTCDEQTRALWQFDEFEGSTIFHDICGTEVHPISWTRLSPRNCDVMATAADSLHTLLALDTRYWSVFVGGYSSPFFPPQWPAAGRASGRPEAGTGSRS